MNAETSISINAPKETIWGVITDIENAATTIKAIDRIEILERPTQGLVGLKWRETRTLFGKQATEVMWITDAAPNDYYRTRAESHGCIYLCRFRITHRDGGCTLTMTFESKPQSVLAKILSIPMGLFLKGVIQKTCQKDLSDIKQAAEQRR